MQLELGIGLADVALVTPEHSRGRHEVWAAGPRAHEVAWLLREPSESQAKAGIRWRWTAYPPTADQPRHGCSRGTEAEARAAARADALDLRAGVPEDERIPRQMWAYTFPQPAQDLWEAWTRLQGADLPRLQRRTLALMMQIATPAERKAVCNRASVPSSKPRHLPYWPYLGPVALERVCDAARAALNPGASGADGQADPEAP